jgi:hypothetical protein
MSSGRGICNGPISCPENSYRLCVCVCVININLYTYNEEAEDKTKNERKKDTP